MVDGPRRRYLAAVTTALAAGVAGCSVVDGLGDGSAPTGTGTFRSPTPGGNSTRTPESPPTETLTPEKPRTLYVEASAEGGGDGSPDDPFGSIQAALGFAGPGATVHVRPGHYYENVTTTSDGDPGEPITITGPPDAVLHGDRFSKPAIGINIDHSHIHLRGLTLDGRLWTGDPFRQDPTDAPPNLADPSRYAISNVDAGYHPFQYVRDLVIKPHGMGYTAGAALDIGKAHDVEIGEFELIGPTGIEFLTGESEGHWGEVVYIGTPLSHVPSSDSIEELDESSNYHVHHVRNTAGHPHAELVEAKPGTSNVTVEYCTDLGGGAHYILPDNDETSEAAIGLRGNDCTLRWCIVENSKGQAVDVGSWVAAAPPDRAEDILDAPLPEGAEELGLNNAIYGNRLRNNGGLAIRFPRIEGQVASEYGPEGQRVICGNEYDGETHGAPAKTCPDWVPRSNEIGHVAGDSPWE